MNKILLLSIVLLFANCKKEEDAECFCNGRFENNDGVIIKANPVNCETGEPQTNENLRFLGCDN